MGTADVNEFYWHGGTAGRGRGALILPPAITGAKSLKLFGNSVCRTDRIYLTTSYAAAVLYAAGHKRGMVYLCDPVGDLEPDPDCNRPGLSWQCESARVLRCVKPKRWEIQKCRQAMIEGH